jgi:hypothetical protein
MFILFNTKDGSKDQKTYFWVVEWFLFLSSFIQLSIFNPQTESAKKLEIIINVHYIE